MSDEDRVWVVQVRSVSSGRVHHVSSHSNWLAALAVGFVVSVRGEAERLWRKVRP